MSANRTRRTVTAVTAAVAAATVLVGVGATSAAADPPSHNDQCAPTLARAGSWPGTTSDGTRLFSDPYENYLSQLPACRPVP